MPRASPEVQVAVALRSADHMAPPPPGPDRLTVAAFDFDGTLTDGGSVFPFLVSLRGTWPVLRAVARLSPALVRAAVTGGSDADRVKEKLFTRLLGGMPVAEVDRRAAAFAQRHLARHLRADTRGRLEWHRRQGHYTVIVSASPECYVRPAGTELGVDGIVATRLAVGGGGLLTGGYEGKNCRGAEKYAAPDRAPAGPGPAGGQRSRPAGAVGLRQQPGRPAPAQRGRPRRRRRAARSARAAAPLPPPGRGAGLIRGVSERHSPVAAGRAHSGRAQQRVSPA